MTSPEKVRTCHVCKVTEWKYKCSQCLLKHCSLSCYKCHLENCQPLKKSRSPTRNAAVSLVPLDLGDDCSDYVPTRLLEKLQYSPKLIDLLSNPHLKEYLIRLDSSKHPAKAIEKGMKEPLFLEFADECLRVLNPESKD